MLSQLGSVFKTTFRQAESTDARLEIRREEKEAGGRKKDDKKDSENEAALWEDSMAVSVTALHGFLVEFLKSHGAPLPAAEDVALSAATTESLPESRPPVSSVAARAVKAYTAMAPATAASFTPPPATEAPVSPADLLSAEEIRTIHSLIADVDTLAKAGIQTLNITLIGTFLESLVEAVRLTKNGPTS